MIDEFIVEQFKSFGIFEDDGKDFLRNINKCQAELSDIQCWQQFSLELLTTNAPFKLHELVYKYIYKSRHNSNPGPVWCPTTLSVKKTNLYAFMQAHNFDDYRKFHRWSTKKYFVFWEKVIERLNICFKIPPVSFCELSKGIEQPNWLNCATLNIVESCFFKKNMSKIAITYNDHQNMIQKITYAELDNLSNRVANSLVDQGFVSGDPIAIVMPMTIESVAIYLGVVKAGCVVVSIAESFASREIEARLSISKAKAIFIQDIIIRANKTIPLYKKLLSIDAPKAIILLLQNNLSISLRDDDILWLDFLLDKVNFAVVHKNPYDHMTILFSSGTTNEPKAIPWDHTSPIKAASDAFFHHDIHPEDIICWPTSLGWMMGPWLIYATFINHATMALYDDVPTSKNFLQFVEKVKVSILGVIPSLVKHWRMGNFLDSISWQHLKLFTSTGEISNCSDTHYLLSRTCYKPMIEYCGGTEISGAYITSTLLQPNIPATFSTPALGLTFDIIDENGFEVDKGEVAIIPPSIGLSRELLNDEHHNVYYDMPKALNGKTYRRHGDQFEKLANGYYRALGRIDDAMNICGVKIGSVEIERSLLGIENIIETAAIAVPPFEGGPSYLVVYAVQKQHDNFNYHEVKAKMQLAIREKLNPLFKIKDLIFIDNIPRTASNKIMRRILREHYFSTVNK